MSRPAPLDPDLEGRAERLLRRLGYTDRLPLLFYLRTPRTLADIGREFSAMQTEQHHHTLNHLLRAGWITVSGPLTKRGGETATVSPLALRTLSDFVQTIFGQAVGRAERFDPGRFRAEVVALRRGRCREVLRAVCANDPHLWALTDRYQLETYGGALRLMRAAGLVAGREVVTPPVPMLGRFLCDLKGAEA